MTTTTQEKMKKYTDEFKKSLDALMSSGNWMTIQDASDDTGIDKDTIRRWCRNHNVESFRVHIMFMVNMPSLKEYAQKRGKLV